MSPNPKMDIDYGAMIFFLTDEVYLRFFEKSHKGFQKKGKTETTLSKISYESYLMSLHLKLRDAPRVSRRTSNQVGYNLR